MLQVVSTGAYYPLVATTWSIRKSSFSNYWNKLSSISNNKNMLMVDATVSYSPLVATTGAHFAKNGEIRV